jgi:glycine dehydrogenase subunit 1
MAQRVTGRNRIIVADTVHPQYRQVAETYTQHGEAEIIVAEHDPETGKLADIRGLDNNTAAVVVQSPNFFGCIEDLAKIADAAHSVGALFIVVVTEAISLGILKPPGAYGADIVVGEGQSFGIPMSFGGPHVGLFATQEKFIRQMPGRLCGIAYDKAGRRGFVLTLSTREQHIRREKATSNICTNQGLIALAATIYMETLGRKGLREVAIRNLQNSAYAADKISAISGYSIPFTAPRFNEFVVRGPRPANEVLETLRAEFGILGGIALSDYFPAQPNDFLVCTTELNTREQIESLADALGQIS